MKKHLLPLLQAAITTYILMRLFGDAGIRTQAREALAAADFYWLLMAAGAAVVSETLCATRWWLILRSFGMPLKWREAVAFSSIGLFYSLGLPGSAGGDAVRSLYVMRLFPDKKLAAAFSVLADRLCGMVALVVAMLATVAMRHEIFLSGELGRSVVLAAGILLAGAMLMLVLWWSTSISALGDFIKRRHKWLSPHLLESGGIFNQMAGRPGTMVAGAALSGVGLAAHFFCYYFSARAFETGLGLAEIFSVMPVVDTLTMVPIALYGLGLREALFTVLLGEFFGVPSATATLLSLGGFGAQAAVALLGIFFLPFVKFLGLPAKKPSSLRD